MKRRNVSKDAGKTSIKRFRAINEPTVDLSAAVLPELPKEIWCNVVAPNLNADDAISLWLTCSAFKGSEYLSKRLKVLNNFYHTEKGLSFRCRLNLAARIRKEDNAEMFLLYYKKIGNMFSTLGCSCVILAKQGCINILKLIERKKLAFKTNHKFAEKQTYTQCSHFTRSKYTGNPGNSLVIAAVVSNHFEIAEWLINELRYPIPRSAYVRACAKATVDDSTFLWLLNISLSSKSQLSISILIEECYYIIQESEGICANAENKSQIEIHRNRCAEYKKIIEMLKKSRNSLKNVIKASNCAK